MALSAMQRSVSRVLQCSRWQKRGIMMITDALILPLLLWGAYALRFSTVQPVVHDSWLFPVDEVFGVHHFDNEELEESPVAISKTDITFTTGLLAWNDSSVGLLDEELLFNALKRSAV